MPTRLIRSALSHIHLRTTDGPEADPLVGGELSSTAKERKSIDVRWGADVPRHPRRLPTTRVDAFYVTLNNDEFRKARSARNPVRP